MSLPILAQQDYTLALDLLAVANGERVVDISHKNGGPPVAAPFVAHAVTVAADAVTPHEKVPPQLVEPP